eukprot:624389_1
MSPSYTLVLTSLAFNALIVKVGIITLCLKMSCPVQFLSKPCPYQFYDALSTVNAHYLRPMYLMDASIPIDSQDTTVDSCIRTLCIHPFLLLRIHHKSIFVMPAQRHQHPSWSNCLLDLLTKTNCSILIIHFTNVSHCLYIPNDEFQFTLRLQWSVSIRLYSTQVSETFRQFIQMPLQSQSTSIQFRFSIIKFTLTPLWILYAIVNYAERGHSLTRIMCILECYKSFLIHKFTQDHWNIRWIQCFILQSIRSARDLNSIKCPVDYCVLLFIFVYGHGFSQQLKKCGNHSFAIASQCVLHQYILVQLLLLWCRESTNPSAICLALIERHRLSNCLPYSHPFEHNLIFYLTAQRFHLFLFYYYFHFLCLLLIIYIDANVKK